MGFIIKALISREKNVCLYVLEQRLPIGGEAVSFYYFTRFNKGLGFHSKIVGNSPFVEEGERRFENHEPSSMGCIRLLLSDAKWLYDEIGLGAKVEVH